MGFWRRLAADMQVLNRPVGPPMSVGAQLVSVDRVVMPLENDVMPLEKLLLTLRNACITLALRLQTRGLSEIFEREVGQGVGK
jgi:hypothetical protein